MTSEPETPAHRAWREQEEADARIPLEEIRSKATRFDAKTRRGRQLGAVLASLLMVANAVQAVWPGRNMVERSGDLLIVAAFVFMGFLYRRDTRYSTQPDGPGEASCLDFYRTLLVRERDFAGQSRRYFLPFVPGVALSLTGGLLEAPSTPRMVGLALGGIALFLGVNWWNAWTARRLQREIDRIAAL